jgi:Holliday junction resolvase RusA-like endonuclease
MPHIRARIDGIPYPRNKPRGDKLAPRVWTSVVVEQTKNLPKIKKACLLRITYRLPRKNMPKNFPYGTDIDNLNKRFLDGLSKTVFSEAPGKDSCVVALEAMKIIVEQGEAAGADIEILPIDVSVQENEERA